MSDKAVYELKLEFYSKCSLVDDWIELIVANC